MFTSIARTRLSTQAFAPIIRRNVHVDHSNAQYAKSKGLVAPVAFLTGSCVFMYACIMAALPTQPRKEQV
ncbi:hypothetical protein K7432_009054 [Basidiobolus ranarum]|uniref:Uncharacterized protein n=1 Tax=Basidiobolus ranarum TaxID=34480 RepID=A0ABR2VXN7_9FUNG